MSLSKLLVLLSDSHIKSVGDVLLKELRDNNIFLPSTDTDSYKRKVLDDGYCFNCHVEAGWGEALENVSALLFVLLLQINIELFKYTCNYLRQPADIYIGFPACALYPGVLRRQDRLCLRRGKLDLFIAGTSEKTDSENYHDC
jgi:hypothetical protein